MLSIRYFGSVGNVIKAIGLTKMVTSFLFVGEGDPGDQLDLLFKAPQPLNLLRGADDALCLFWIF